LGEYERHGTGSYRMSVAATVGESGASARRARADARLGGWPTAAGILAGVAADALLGDPRRGHPVTLFGRAAQAVQQRAYADSRLCGAGYAAGCALAAALAPVVGGRPAAAWRSMRRYGGRHPSPNGGQCEAAFAGALGVRLGETNSYTGAAEHRPVLGQGRAPEPAGILRAVRLCRAVTIAATAAAAATAVAAAAADAAIGVRRP